MSEFVKIYINDQEYEVPGGTNLVDVAKFYADEDIPVFCYHPKMEPVGMCRMCLVEMGSIQRDRETNEVVIDDNGNHQVRWFPKLQTACTQNVFEGMVIRTDTEEVREGRDNMVEFILTSHPLDCPICDKGGECPLQNLTMRHGSGSSRFHFEDKVNLEKHVPLGDLIYLDRERCIQCARCTRFQDELVGDDVLAFHERGRRLQIITISDPPFDTYYSGNTTDICPVGALTTADFRFGARPWELKEVPSLDIYGPEGANISLSTRLDRDSGGVVKIKRVMPRQNEHVNEIWISDKTRFGHHHTLSNARLEYALVRGKSGSLNELSLDAAHKAVSNKLKDGGSVGAIAGATLSNEDLWELRKLVESLGGGKLGIFPATMTGAEVVSQVGVAKGTNLGELGKGDVIVVVASALQEEAPIWWLRAKTAGDRGAELIVINARETKLDEYANHSIRYDYGKAVSAVTGLDKDVKASIKDANNAVVFVGGEGLTLEQHGELMKAAGNLLIETKHVGTPNNGLIPVWEGANVQGALDLGFSAEDTLDMYNNPPEILIVAGADPVGEDSRAAKLGDAGFVLVTTLFETATTEIADVVIPAQSFAERHGSFTSGERRVQRFYPAQGEIGESQPDWKTFGQLRNTLDNSGAPRLAAGIMTEIATNVENYADVSYKSMSKIERQFPDVGGQDNYYGGTAYNNTGGIGVQYAVAAEADKVAKYKVSKANETYKGLTVIPVTMLYDKGMHFKHSELMHNRIGDARILLNADTAAAQKIEDGAQVAVKVGDLTYEVVAVVNDSVPADVVLMPKRMSETPSLFVPAKVDTIEMIAEPVGAEG